MAELLAAGGIVEQGSVALYLSEMLPQDHIVVANAMVFQHPLDAVVISPKGLALCQVVDWEAIARLSPRASATGGGDTRSRHLAAGAQQAIQAMRAFLQDEFPDFQPIIRHFHVVSISKAEFSEWKVLEPTGLRQETLAETLMADELAPDATLVDEEARAALGEALQQRRLARSQRAPKPFIFRSGGPFGTRTRAWSIRSLVRHMDRHPDDGIHHLSNGTLEKWLEEVGAPHLAELARSAVRDSPTDYRQALELFLVGTGLVTRRRPTVRPKQVDLGYIVAGDSASAIVRLHRKGGYCFGELRTSHPWAQVEPRSFQGEPCRALVTVNTSSLLIDPEPYQARIIVSSRAMPEAVEIPVRFRVVPRPSLFQRVIVRPAGGLLFAGALGAGIGLLMALAGVWPGMMPSTPAAFGPYAAGAVIGGLLWAICGIIWGALFPLAWPFLYALPRLLAQVLFWALALALIALAGYGLAYWRLGIPLPPLGGLLISAVLYGLMLAIVPAVISELVRGRRTVRLRPEKAGRARRWALLAIALMLLLAAVLLLPQAVESVQRNVQVQNVWASAQERMANFWERLNSEVDELLRQYYLRIYDRRAP